MAPPGGASKKGKRNKGRGDEKVSSSSAENADAIDDNVLLDALNALAAQEQQTASPSPSISEGRLSKTSLLVALLAVVLGLVLYHRQSSTTLFSLKSNPSKKSVKDTDTATDKARQTKTTAKALTAIDILKRSKTLPCKDRDDPEICAELAARGDCDVALGWSIFSCAAACNRCELLDSKKRCTEENMGVKLVDAYQPGDMDKMFEELVARSDLNVTVLHKKPWLVLVRDFIPEDESSALLNLTVNGMQRSKDQDPRAKNGLPDQFVGKHRTSSNSWCFEDCEAHPKVKSLMKRISNLVHVPLVNFEGFQVLRYEETQKYDVHHDGKLPDPVLLLY